MILNKDKKKLIAKTLEDPYYWKANISLIARATNIPKSTVADYINEMKKTYCIAVRTFSKEKVIDKGYQIWKWENDIK